ncbi:unnamed protein product [Auanema sp. JU1783]|nr:unnamed protein product [Auanema sp. JU1783]
MQDSSDNPVPIKKLKINSEDSENGPLHDEIHGDAQCGYTYHDHPADIQLHSWGPNLSSALEQLVCSMYGYMVGMDTVEETYTYYFTATGHDEHSLIFSVLEEPLVAFQSEPFFIGKRVEVISVKHDPFEVVFCAHGESFQHGKHKQLTDVKAITHSNMQVIEKDSLINIFVIVDI